MRRRLRRTDSLNNPSERGKIILLWLDDERDPFDERWHKNFPIKPDRIVWVKSYSEFVCWINNNRLPDAVCFDHDLGKDIPSGMDAAKFLSSYCMNLDFPLPNWAVHSANPEGKKNIESLLNSYTKSRLL